MIHSPSLREIEHVRRTRKASPRMLMSPVGVPEAGIWTTGGAWTFAKAPGLLNWFEANGGTTTSSTDAKDPTASSWPNRANPGTVTPVQGTALNQPSFGTAINGKRTVHFPAAAAPSAACYDCGVGSPAPLSTKYWALCVAVGTLGSDAGIYNRWWNSNTFNLGGNAFVAANTMSFFVADDTAAATAAANSTIGGTPYCYLGYFDGSLYPSNTTFLYQLAGGVATLQTAQGKTNVGSMPTGTSDRTAIGAGMQAAGGAPTGDNFAGDIALIADGNLNPIPSLPYMAKYVLAKWNI